MRRLSAIAAGAALMLVGVLSGCASSSAPGETAVEIDATAAWLDGGRLIGIVTQGSSSCVPVAGETTAEGGTLKVTFEDVDADQPCTADMTSRVTLADVPEGVDPASDLTVEISGDGIVGTTTLAGVAGLAPGGATDYAPSAGWTGASGELVVLTWGSSSCAPVVEDVAAVDTTVTVTFQTPAADRVCTMDMAPRAFLVQIEGLDGVADVQLVLTGDSFDGTTLPIYGVA